MVTLYKDERYRLVAQQKPSLLQSDVISAYKSLALGISLLSYLTLAGITA